jgi:hypothetical protein
MRFLRFVGAADQEVHLHSVDLPPLCDIDWRCHMPAWGVIWLIQAFIMFAIGVIVGLVAFKVRFLSFCGRNRSDRPIGN